MMGTSVNSLNEDKIKIKTITYIEEIMFSYYINLFRFHYGRDLLLGYEVRLHYLP